MPSPIGEQTLTIVITKNESVDSVETKERQEIPAQGRHPSDVEIGRLDAPLKHHLEPHSEWEGELDCVTEAKPSRARQ